MGNFNSSIRRQLSKKLENRSVSWVKQVCTAGRSDFADEAVLRSIHKLRQASQPVYATLFVPISNQPGGLSFTKVPTKARPKQRFGLQGTCSWLAGIKFLTDLRADVLAAVGKEPGGQQAWHLRALGDAIK